jgi:hypothetical protein
LKQKKIYANGSLPLSFFSTFGVEILMKFNQNIGNLVEFTFKRKIILEFSQFFCFKK